MPSQTTTADIPTVEPVRVDQLDTLAPAFKAPYDAWIAEAQRQIQHVEFRTIETRRTLQRQSWLYAQGRAEPYLDTPQITWTLDSRHRWGLAADWIMVRRDNRGNPTAEVIWSIQSYKWVYRTVPPGPYGLRHIGPAEWMHVELLLADEALEHASQMDLKQT